jgi:hypothetical protein
MVIARANAAWHGSDQQASAVLVFTRFAGAGVPEDQLLQLRVRRPLFHSTAVPNSVFCSRKKCFMISCVIAIVVGFFIGLYFITKNPSKK